MATSQVPCPSSLGKTCGCLCLVTYNLCTYIPWVSSSGNLYSGDRTLTPNSAKASIPLLVIHSPTLRALDNVLEFRLIVFHSKYLFRLILAGPLAVLAFSMPFIWILNTVVHLYLGRGGLGSNVSKKVSPVKAKNTGSTMETTRPSGRLSSEIACTPFMISSHLSATQNHLLSQQSQLIQLTPNRKKYHPHNNEKKYSITQEL